MRAELLEMLRSIARGEHAANGPVTTATPVTLQPGDRPKVPELQALREIQVERGNKGKSDFSPAPAPVTARPEPDEAALEERAGLAADRVPAVYLDAWARLNHQKPFDVSEAEWRLALDDGGRFLDALGHDAAALGWSPNDLFAVTAGLVWRLASEHVVALGPDHARLGDGRTLMRLR